MKLEDYLDVSKLAKYVANGLVTCRPHNSLPLSIYCYGRKAVYDNIWDDVTCRTRGLIVDNNTHEIIARPYEKFFSIEHRPDLLDEAELEEALGNKPTITEKVNGCLGIFWKYKQHWGIASKGSFHSPHVEFATKWMEDHIENYGKLVFPEDYTPVFEIICQEIQPHVIKYPKDQVILLSFINIETGEELHDAEMHGYGSLSHLSVTRLVDLTLEQALAVDTDQIEGYVATYNHNGFPPLKIKIKFPTFLENRKKFYAEQKANEAVITTYSNLSRYAEIHAIVAEIIKDALVYCTDRKEFIKHFSQPETAPYKAICIAMLDTNTKKYQELIWKMVKNGS